MLLPALWATLISLMMLWKQQTYDPPYGGWFPATPGPGLECPILQHEAFKLFEPQNYLNSDKLICPLKVPYQSQSKIQLSKIS